jgi:antitoxin ParD1/3/4
MIGKRAMTLIKKSFTVTDQQAGWIKAQLASGRFGNESEVVRDLIRERQMREEETPEQIKAIRSKLIEAEKSGFSDQTIDQIWAEARKDA